MALPTCERRPWRGAAAQKHSKTETARCIAPAVHAQALRRNVRFQRLKRHLHALGPLGELLLELVEVHGIGDDVLEHLKLYSDLSDFVVEEVGGRDWPPLPLIVVGGAP